MAATTTTPGFNLTQATYLARLTVKYGSIALVFLMVGRVLLGAMISYWKATHPPEPPPPTAGFGSLPAIIFPEQGSESKPKNYQLETPTGTTPNFGDRAKVFLMIRATPSLMADQRARELAASYNFLFEPEVLDTASYRWAKSQPIEMQLEMNIFNQHFELTSDYLSRPELIANPNLPDEYQAVALVKNVLSTGGLLPDDVATSAGRVSYYKSLGGELGKAVSLSDADYLRIELDRAPIDNAFQSYGPDGETGTIHAILTGALNGNDSVVELTYGYQPVDYTEIETYAIRTSQAAWKVVQAGEAYLANPGTEETAVIRQVTLGYYESPTEQEYLQPIFVFHGDGGFLAYVPAVDPEFIQAE